MGPVLPPQRKGKMPLYGRNRLVELQSKFDDLERQGVFARPEDIGVTRVNKVITNHGMDITKLSSNFRIECKNVVITQFKPNGIEICII